MLQSTPNKQLESNPFFYHDGIGWKVSSKVMVEIIHTKDIDISHRPLTHMTNVPHQTGKRRNPQKRISTVWHAIYM